MTTPCIFTSNAGLYPLHGGRISGGVEHRCAAADLPKGEPVQRGAGGGWAAAAAGCPHRQRNSLVEPFSGLPVAVCSLSVAAKLLSAELLSAMLCGQGNQLHRVRQIPFLCRRAKRSAAGGQGERLTICCESQAPKVSEAFYLAVTQQPIGGGGVAAAAQSRIGGCGNSDCRRG